MSVCFLWLTHAQHIYESIFVVIFNIRANTVKHIIYKAKTVILWLQCVYVCFLTIFSYTHNMYEYILCKIWQFKNARRNIFGSIARPCTFRVHFTQYNVYHNPTCIILHSWSPFEVVFKNVSLKYYLGCFDWACKIRCQYIFNFLTKCFFFFFYKNLDFLVFFCFR